MRDDELAFVVDRVAAAGALVDRKHGNVGQQGFGDRFVDAAQAGLAGGGRLGDPFVDIVGEQDVDAVAGEDETGDALDLVGLDGDDAHSARQGAGEEVRILRVRDFARQDGLLRLKRGAGDHADGAFGGGAATTDHAGLRIDAHEAAEHEMLRPCLCGDHVFLNGGADGNGLRGDVDLLGAHGRGGSNRGLRRVIAAGHAQNNDSHDGSKDNSSD